MNEREHLANLRTSAVEGRITLNSIRHCLQIILFFVAFASVTYGVKTFLELLNS